MPVLDLKKGFISHKELAIHYGVTPGTLTRYLKKGIPLLWAVKNIGKQKRGGPKTYSPAEVQLIIKHFG